MKDYHPVSGDMTDELEAFSTLKTSLRFRVTEPHGKEEWLVGKITNIFARDHADFLCLQDGIEVRLDRILSYEPV